MLIERERTALTDTLKQESSSLLSQFSDYEFAVNHIIWNENVIQTLNRTYDNNFDMYIAYRDTIDPLFLTMQALNPYIQAITIYTDLAIHPHGNMLRPLSQFENDAWYPEILDSYKSMLVTDSKQQVLSYLCQFHDMQENHTALLKMNINYNLAFSSLSSLYEESYGILIVDREGAPVYQFHTEDMQDFDISSEHITEAAGCALTSISSC